MSLRHMLAMLVVLGGALAYTGRYAVSTFPLAASAQTTLVASQDIVHRTAVPYPPEAVRNRIEGTVVVELTLDAGGRVTGQRVVSGPEALRQATLRSVLDWHFKSPPAPGTTRVSVEFRLPEQTEAAPAPAPAPTRAPESAMSTVTMVVKQIDASQLSESLREQVLRKVPVREGGILDMSMYRSLAESVKEVDEHLVVGMRPLAQQPESGPREVTLTFTIPQAVNPNQPEAASGASPPTRIRIGGNVQAAKMVSQPSPEYPPLARQARIQGVVRFNVVLDKEGAVSSAELVSGHPLLAQAALDAVRQWKYQPTLLNGQPVEVVTQADVNFALAETGPQ